MWCPCPVQPPWAPGTGAVGMHSGPKSERLDAESQHKWFLEDFSRQFSHRENTVSVPEYAYVCVYMSLRLCPISHNWTLCQCHSLFNVIPQKEDHCVLFFLCCLNTTGHIQFMLHYLCYNSFLSLFQDGLVFPLIPTVVARSALFVKSGTPLCSSQMHNQKEQGREWLKGKTGTQRRCTWFLTYAAWLSYMCDRFTPALFRLSQSGCDAAHFISITLGEIPKLTAYTITLRHTSKETWMKKPQRNC